MAAELCMSAGNAG